MDEEIDVYAVVKKLVGDIKPVGETNTDDDRFENLKVFTGVVEKLLQDIHELDYRYKNNHQYSMKRASEYASKFLDSQGIKE